MYEQPLYFFQIRKERRTRIKLWIKGSVAQAVLVICHIPVFSGIPCTWEIKTMTWNLEMEEERKEYKQLLASCQREQSRNFKIAITEAVIYGKRLNRQRKLEARNFGSFSIEPSAIPGNELSTTSSRFVYHVPLISKEEIIQKIHNLRAI